VQAGCKPFHFNSDMVHRSVVSLVLTHQAIAADYNESQALTYAYLSTAAYCSYPHVKSNDLLEQWACGPACDAVPGFSDTFTINGPSDQDAFAFGGKLNGECTLVFRGTSNGAGWSQDLKSLKLVDLSASLVSPKPVKCSYEGKSCQVGVGFMDNYNILAPHIVGNLTRIGCDVSEPLVVVGHSLGAAEAAIGMYDLKNQGYAIARSYTFGQPRVGDLSFVKAFEAALSTTDLFRVTHASDPVVQTPFTSKGFSHMSQEVFYAGDVSNSYKICDGSGEDKSCANSRSGNFFIAGLACADTKHPSKCDHLTYMHATKTILMDGSSCAGQDMIV